jgi:hypothetical protein
MNEIPEPWMFGVEVSVNGVPLGPGQIGKFTLLGRWRMRLRTLRGKPAWTILPDADEPA